MIKVLSDTHFYHTKIREFHRPEYRNINEMNEAIIEKWNKEINPKDKVIHLGDFAFGNDLEAIENIIKRLNGNITLILGNHDTAYKVSELYTKYFKCLGSLTMKEYYFSHEPLHFQAINPDQLRSTGRQAIINIHGHLHNGEFCSKEHINCCFDVVGIDNMVRKFVPNKLIPKAGK